MQVLPIAIVGAGTAGLASAILLARQGWRVTLYERVADLQPVGAGVLLQPSGLAALRHLGLLDECTALGAPVSRLFGTSACAQRVILDTRYAHWQAGAVGLGIHRGVLMTALLGAARAAGVTIRTGMGVSRFAQSATHVRLFAEDGQGNESLLGEHAALILADGTRSRLRTQMQVRQSVKAYPWGALWSIVPTPVGADSTDLRQWYRGCSQMFGIMPTGCTHLDRHTRLSSLFWSLPVAGHGVWQQAGLEAWKQSVRQLAGEPAEAFLHTLDKAEKLMLASYADVRMHQWHDGRVVAIGDCAHAMSPQLGQGANMALVDAVALSQALGTGEGTRAADFSSCFAAYGAVRRAHLRYYRQASRLLTPLFQSHSAGLALLRDSALFVARHLPAGRRHAVTTLVGARTGWLFSGKGEAPLHAWENPSSAPPVQCP